MTPLARRIVAVVVGVLVLAVVVLVLSVSPGPTARAGLILLGAGLVVLGVITAVLVRWFRKELAETNRATAVEVMSEAGVDPEELDDDARPEVDAGSSSVEGTLARGDDPGEPDDRRGGPGGRRGVDDDRHGADADRRGHPGDTGGGGPDDDRSDAPGGR